MEISISLEMAYELRRIVYRAHEFLSKVKCPNCKGPTHIGHCDFEAHAEWLKGRCEWASEIVTDAEQRAVAKAGGVEAAKAKRPPPLSIATNFRFVADAPGDPEAGIPGSYNEIRVTFTEGLDEEQFADATEALRKTIADILDAFVETGAEHDAAARLPDREGLSEQELRMRMRQGDSTGHIAEQGY